MEEVKNLNKLRRNLGDEAAYTYEAACLSLLQTYSHLHTLIHRTVYTAPIVYCSVLVSLPLIAELLRSADIYHDSGCRTSHVVGKFFL